MTPLRAERERVARLQRDGALLRAAPAVAGVRTTAVAHPAVPPGRDVLRLTVTATHTDDQLREAAQAVAAAARRARDGDRELAPA